MEESMESLLNTLAQTTAGEGLESSVLVLENWERSEIRGESKYMGQ